MAGHGGWVFSVAFSPDGLLALTVSEDFCAKIWSACSGLCLRTLTHPTDFIPEVSSAEFSADGLNVITSGIDGTARIHSSGSGHLVQTLDGKDGSLRSATFSPDGQKVLTASDSGNAKVFSLQSGECEQTLFYYDSETMEYWNPDLDEDPWISASFTTDGRKVICSSRFPSLCSGFLESTRVMSALSGECLHVLEGKGVALSP